MPAESVVNVHKSVYSNLPGPFQGHPFYFTGLFRLEPTEFFRSCRLTDSFRLLGASNTSTTTFLRHIRPTENTSLETEVSYRVKLLEMKYEEKLVLWIFFTGIKVNNYLQIE